MNRISRSWSTAHSGVRPNRERMEPAGPEREDVPHRAHPSKRRGRAERPDEVHEHGGEEPVDGPVGDADRGVVPGREALLADQVVAALLGRALADQVEAHQPLVGGRGGPMPELHGAEHEERDGRSPERQSRRSREQRDASSEPGDRIGQEAGLAVRDPLARRSPEQEEDGGARTRSGGGDDRPAVDVEHRERRADGPPRSGDRADDRDHEPADEGGAEADRASRPERPDEWLSLRAWLPSAPHVHDGGTGDERREQGDHGDAGIDHGTGSRRLERHRGPGECVPPQAGAGADQDQRVEGPQPATGVEEPRVAQGPRVAPSACPASPVDHPDRLNEPASTERGNGPGETEPDAVAPVLGVGDDLAGQDEPGPEPRRRHQAQQAVDRLEHRAGPLRRVHEPGDVQERERQQQRPQHEPAGAGGEVGPVVRRHRRVVARPDARLRRRERPAGDERRIGRVPEHRGRRRPADPVHAKLHAVLPTGPRREHRACPGTRGGPATDPCDEGSAR